MILNSNLMKWTLVPQLSVWTVCVLPLTTTNLLDVASFPPPSQRSWSVSRRWGVSGFSLVGERERETERRWEPMVRSDLEKSGLECILASGLWCVDWGMWSIHLNEHNDPWWLFRRFNWSACRGWTLAPRRVSGDLFSVCVWVSEHTHTLTHTNTEAEDHSFLFCDRFIESLCLPPDCRSGHTICFYEAHHGHLLIWPLRCPSSHIIYLSECLRCYCARRHFISHMLRWIVSSRCQSGRPEVGDQTHLSSEVSSHTRECWGRT